MPRTRPIVFFSKKKEVFRINISYEKGDDPIQKLENFFREIDGEVANINHKKIHGVSFEFKEGSQ